MILTAVQYASGSWRWMAIGTDGEVVVWNAELFSTARAAADDAWLAVDRAPQMFELEQ